MFTTLQEMDAFENAVRAIIKGQRAKLNMSDETVGKIAFSFMPRQRTKVQALLVGQGAGKYRKPQRMRTPDLMNLCEALGLKWQDVSATLKRRFVVPLYRRKPGFGEWPRSRAFL